MFLGRRKYVHAQVYHNLKKKLSKVLIALATMFHNKVLREVGRSSAEEKIVMTKSEMYEILKYTLRKKQFTLESIPKHVWCEVAILAIADNFADKESRKWLVLAIYKLYLKRGCLATSTNHLDRFEAEHSSYLKTRSKISKRDAPSV